MLPTERPTPQRLDGRVLAFATRSRENTHKQWRPRGAARTRMHGIFTWSMVEALRRGVADAASLRSPEDLGPTPQVRRSGSEAMEPRTENRESEDRKIGNR